MKKTVAVILRFGTQLLSLIIIGIIVLLYCSSFATKDVIAPILVLATMAGLLIVDIVEYFLFKRLALDNQKFCYNKLNRWICDKWRIIRKLPLIVYFFIGFLWKLFIGLVIPNLSEQGANISITERVPNLSIIFAALILAPLIETLLFQALPIELSNKITKKCSGKPCILFSIIVSALLFAVEHRFSIEYMLYAFIMGLYLSFFYIFTSKVYGKDWKKGYIATVLLHVFFNIFAITSLLILNTVKGN